jgi:hypothetical protein
LELFDIYVLNLAVTAAMFIVLMFRAWVEFRNYKVLWKEMEWQKTRRTAKEVLRDEKETFSKTEGGQELYEVLCHLFEAES